MEEYACFTQCPRDIADNCWLEHSGWTRRDYNLLNVGYYGILPVASFELFFVLCFGTCIFNCDRSIVLSC